MENSPSLSPLTTRTGLRKSTRRPPARYATRRFEHQRWSRCKGHQARAARSSPPSGGPCRRCRLRCASRSAHERARRAWTSPRSYPACRAGAPCRRQRLGSRRAAERSAGARRARGRRILRKGIAVTQEQNAGRSDCGRNVSRLRQFNSPSATPLNGLGSVYLPRHCVTLGSTDTRNCRRPPCSRVRCTAHVW
jgi:hypothetical protein